MEEFKSVIKIQSYIHKKINEYKNEKKILEPIEVLHNLFFANENSELFNELSIRDKEMLVKRELVKNYNHLEKDIINIAQVVNPKNDSVLLVSEKNASGLLLVKDNISSKIYGLSTADKPGLDIISNLMHEQNIDMICDLGAPLIDIRTRQLFDLVISNNNCYKAVDEKTIANFKKYIGTNYDFSQIENYSNSTISYYLYAIRALECVKDQNSYIVINFPKRLDLSFFMKLGYLEAVISFENSTPFNNDNILILSKQSHNHIDFYSIDNIKDFSDLWNKELDKMDYVLLNNQSSKVSVSYEKVLDLNNYQSKYYINDVSGKLKNTILLGDIAEIQRGYMNREYGVDNKDEIIDGEAVLLKVSDLHDGNIYNDELTFNISKLSNITNPKILSLQKGDILISVRGYNQEIGLVTEENAKIPIFCGYHLVLIRIKDDRFTPEYLYAYLRSENGQKLFNQQSKSQISININALKNYPVEIPDKESLTKITQQISTYINEIRQNYQNTKNYRQLINECYDLNSNKS